MSETKFTQLATELAKTVQAVERALDLAEAPHKDGDRWLTLPERVDALAKARGELP